MTNIEFYFDPSCPWCWITSRWLTVVQQERDINVTWLPFSLTMKNNEMEGKGDSPYPEMHKSSHRVLRVIEELAVKENADRGELYSAFGKKHFVEQREYSDELITEVLNDNDYTSSYLEAADSTSQDAALEENLNNAIKLVGDDVGVPLIIFVDENGNKNGYFGPVITELPEKEEALNLWDGLEKLASSSKFFELKRGRTSGADVSTTSKLFS